MNLKIEGSLKIESGKFYKTRGGDKARIYALDGRSSYPVHGAMLISSGWQSYAWTATGKDAPVDAECSNDIVSLWEEPEEKEYLEAIVYDPKPYTELILGTTNFQIGDKVVDTTAPSGKVYTVLNIFEYNPPESGRKLLEVDCDKSTYWCTSLVTPAPSDPGASDERQDTQCQCRFIGLGHDDDCVLVKK